MTSRNGAQLSLSMQLHAIGRFKKRLVEASRLGIRPTDLVLDLGSGQDPHPRANVLCDKFVADSGERACGAGLVVDRAFVMADATATPFPDKAFDFVFCCHLLEHMEDPAALLREVQRIGRRGYIETPSQVYEKLWGWPFHRWFVSNLRGKLLLEEKDSTIFDHDLHEWFGARMEEPRFWRFIMPRLFEMGLLTALVWEDEITFEVRRASVPPVVENAAGVVTEFTPPPLTSAQKLKSKLARWSRRQSDGRVPDLMDRLVCPRCHTPLSNPGSTRECKQCPMSYAVRGSTVVALTTAETVSTSV